MLKLRAAIRQIFKRKTGVLCIERIIDDRRKGDVRPVRLKSNDGVVLSLRGLSQAYRYNAFQYAS